MARKNTRKKVLAASKSQNPFDVKVSRQKHFVLGHKAIGTTGLPGVSRALGDAKRREQWHKKKIKSQKSNKFIDKRIMDNNMSFEEQATLRFVQVRKKKFQKTTFNLNNREFLTHKGKPMHDEQSYMDRANHSDDDDEEQLPSDFVNKAHFGGFSSETPKTRKEIINDLIVDSKRRKLERKIENDQNAQLTEQLDRDWKDLLPLMSGLKGCKSSEVSEKKDSYDVSLYELKFDMRASAVKRVKTQEEIAEEQKKKLLEYEAEKCEKMHDDRYKIMDNHISADSIDDDFYVKNTPMEEVHDTHLSDEAKNSETDESDNADLDSAANVDTSLINKNDCKQSAISQTIEEFKIIIESCTSDEVSNKVDSILKSYLPCQSRKKLAIVEGFFKVLLEYIFKENVASLETFPDLYPHLHKLAEVSPEKTAEIILSFLDQEYDLYEENGETEKKKNSPRLQMLMLFKLCTTMYRSTDFKHPVVTPTFIFMGDVLCSEYRLTIENVIRRLFISRLFLEAVAESKRLVPEAIHFLNKILFLVNDNKPAKKSKLNMKYKIIDLIVPEQDHVVDFVEIDLLQKNPECDSAFKASILREVLKQLQAFAELYVHLPSYPEIFSKTTEICSKLINKKYSDVLLRAISTLQDTITNNTKPRFNLVYKNKRPKPLKLFEPKFGSKFTPMTDDIARKRKLIVSIGRKIRKEERNQLRSIRRETRVIAGERLKEKLEADKERKQKVKELYRDLAMQEGDFKKMLKKK